MVGFKIRAKGKSCECQGAITTEVIGIVMKEINAVNGQWLMLDTPSGTKTVKIDDIIEVYEQ